MSQLELSNRTLTLHRFPQMREESPLQAWDAADEYLLRHLDDAPVNGPTLIFNDTFGALGCALAGEGVYSISDSWLNQQATRQNLALNGLDEGGVQLLDSLAPLPAAPARVLMKVPKTLALLEQQLRALRAVVTPQTQIIAAGKAKDIHTSTLQLFEKVLGPTTTSLAWKKARLIYGTFTQPELAESDVIARWQLDGVSPFEKVRILDPHPDMAMVEEGLAAMRSEFPSMAGVRLEQAWGGMIDSTPDAVPVISPVGKLPGLIISAGYSAHGFGIGPGAGRLAADLATHDTPIVDAKPFRYERLIDGSGLDAPGMM